MVNFLQQSKGENAIFPKTYTNPNRLFALSNTVESHPSTKALILFIFVQNDFHIKFIDYYIGRYLKNSKTSLEIL